MNKPKTVRMKERVNSLIKDIHGRVFPADKLIIFGSFVRGDVKERSDLDICVVADIELSIKEKRELENYFYTAVGQELCIDFLYCDRDRLANGDQVFESIRREGRVLYERL